MKRRKKLWIMAAILGLTLFLTITAALIDQKTEQIRESGQAILEIPVDTVTALSWDHDGETLSFTREGDTWHYDGDPDFPVSQLDMENMLDPLSGLTAAFRIEKVEDYSQYGLDAPICTVGITAGEDSWQIRLGAYSRMDQQRYVDIGDGSVYLVYHDPMMEFDTELSQVIDNDDVPYLDSADRITFTGAQTYTIEKEPEDGTSHRPEDLYFARQNGALLPLSTDSVKNYLSDLTLLTLTDYQTYTASQTDLSQWGLDTPELSIQVDYTRETDREETPQQKSFTLHLARDPIALAEAQAAEDPDTVTVPVYVRMNNSELIYEINSVDYESLIACSYDDLRHSEIFPAHTEDIVSMDITLDGSLYTVTGVPGEKKEDPRVFTWQEQEVDLNPVLTALQSLHAEQFTEEAPAGKLEVQLAVTLADESRVTLDLYRKDGTHCLAAVDGVPTALLPRSQAVTLTEAIRGIVLNPAEAEAA